MSGLKTKGNCGCCGAVNGVTFDACLCFTFSKVVHVFFVHFDDDLCIYEIRIFPVFLTLFYTSYQTKYILPNKISATAFPIQRQSYESPVKLLLFHYLRLYHHFHSTENLFFLLWLFALLKTLRNSKTQISWFPGGLLPLLCWHSAHFLKNCVEESKKSQISQLSCVEQRKTFLVLL